MVVRRFMSQGWARRPSVPLDYYGLLLVDALSRAANYRTPDVIMMDMELNEENLTDETYRAFLFEVRREFDAVQGSSTRLEEIKPEPKELLDLHVLAIGYLRAFLYALDKSIALGMELTAGQLSDREVRKRQKEIEGWNQSLKDVSEDFSVELHKVRTKQPHMYATLGIPDWVLSELGLR